MAWFVSLLLVYVVPHAKWLLAGELGLAAGLFALAGCAQVALYFLAAGLAAIWLGRQV
jgi:hypothetical protein